MGIWEMKWSQNPQSVRAQAGSRPSEVHGAGWPSYHLSYPGRTRRESLSWDQWLLLPPGHDSLQDRVCWAFWALSGSSRSPSPSVDVFACQFTFSAACCLALDWSLAILSTQISVIWKAACLFQAAQCPPDPASISEEPHLRPSVQECRFRLP